MKLIMMENHKEIKESSRAVECKAVQLLPFENQVGGHQCLLTYDEYTICKPLEDRELEFYTSIPEILRPFTPEFKGVVDVHFIKDDKGKAHFLGIPTSCQCSSECKVEAFRSGDEIRKRLLWSLISNCRCPKYDDSLPWVDEMQGRLVSDAKKENRKGIKFILLGNVAAKLKRPCILDIKMGTRQYGDDDPVEKVRRKNERSASSTSKALGVRLCGMQVFNCEIETFNFVDKYIGRELNEDGFKKSINSFLHNGNKLLSGLIDPLLTKLKELHNVIEATDCYRFYACSLLLIYDGMSYEEELADSVDIRVIDFAKVSKKGDVHNEHKGPDHGLLLGLQTLICILQQLKNN